MPARRNKSSRTRGRITAVILGLCEVLCCWAEAARMACCPRNGNQKTTHLADGVSAHAILALQLMSLEPGISIAGEASIRATQALTALL